ncbi:MAG: hypothetical protein ABIB43_06965 [archaeon]
MKSRLIILPIMLIILASFATAATNFYVTNEPIKSDIFISEIALFEVTVFNLLSTEDVYTFTTLDSRWTILSPQLVVPGDGMKSFTLEIDPGSTIPLGVHALNIKIKSLRGETFTQQLFVINIRPYNPLFGEYNPSVQFSADIDEEIDPRKKIPVSIFMKNRNALDIGDATIVIDGELFEGEFKTTLAGMEEKRTEYLFKVDESQAPGLYSLDVQLQIHNITISRSTQNYEIISYSSITRDSIEESFFFKTIELITLENLGNTKTTTKVNLETPFVKRLFTYSDPDYEVAKINGEGTLQWEVTIEPQEMTQITVTTNYRIPIIIIILIIVGIVFYYVTRSPILLMKEAIVVGSDGEGVEHLKLRLFVKNRSRKTIDRVVVFDRIPSIAEVIQKKILGTIQPDKITKQEKKGTIIKWSLETLEPFEERIITYEMKSKLKIIGNVSLPSCRATFFGKNRDRTVYSNRVVVSG